MEIPEDVLAARERLRARFATAQVGGPGTARRKGKRTHKPTINDEKKTLQALQRLRAQEISGIEVVEFHHSDGRVMQFNRPRLQAAVPNNLYAVTGSYEERDIKDDMEELLAKLGKHDADSYKQVMEHFGSQNQALGAKEGGLTGPSGLDFESTAREGVTASVQD